MNTLTDTNSAAPSSSVYLQPRAPSPGTLTTLSRTLRSRPPAAPCISPGRPTSFSGPPVCGNPLWRGTPSLEPPWRSAVTVSRRSVSHKTCLRSCSFNLAGEPLAGGGGKSSGRERPRVSAACPPRPRHTAPPTDPQLPRSTCSVCGSHVDTLPFWMTAICDGMWLRTFTQVLYWNTILRYLDFAWVFQFLCYFVLPLHYTLETNIVLLTLFIDKICFFYLSAVRFEFWLLSDFIIRGYMSIFLILIRWW